MKRILQVVAVAGLLIAGYIHLSLYFDGYRSVPIANLGRSFIANAVSATIIAIALLFGLARPRRSLRIVADAAALAWAVGSLGALRLSRTSFGIFGFQEVGWQPAPEVALVVASVSIVLVCVAADLVLAWRRRA